VNDVSKDTAASSTSGVLQRAELKRRASAGLFVLGSRGVMMLVLGLGGSVVLARLLTPHDFGAVAIGLTFISFATVLSDGGLGAGLIRRPETPDRRELQALSALQLGITLAIAVCVAAVALLFGETGAVTALMVWSMPVVVLQTPGKIMLERSLDFPPLALLEVAQMAAYYTWAIATVVAGLGVWGLASATLAKAFTGVLIMSRVSPVGLVPPRLSWSRVRPLMRFGLEFQATNAVWILRDQGINLSTAALAGIPALGLWSFARRLMEIPNIVFDALFRVAFPTMSQLVRGKQETAPLIERALGISALGFGLLLAGITASAPGLVPAIFGAKWIDATYVIPGACLGFAVAGSVSVASVGFLYAVGDSAAVLRASIAATAAIFVVLIPLLPFIGVSAVGVSLVGTAVVDAWVIARATRKYVAVRYLRCVAVPIGVAIVTGSGGWLVSHAAGANFVAGVLGGASTAVSFCVLMFLLDRALLAEARAIVLGAARDGVRRRADVVDSAPSLAT
jgi:O-antigen/teichoic acid export membrane protein